MVSNNMTLDEEIALLSGGTTSTPDIPEFNDMRVDQNQLMMDQMERDFNPNDYDNTYDPNFPEEESLVKDKFKQSSYQVDINQMLANLAESEGGWANHPEDKGGPTMRGITLETYRRYVNPKATINDLKKLTKEEANDIYVKEYYYGMNVDKLPEPLQELVFDMNVLHGPKNAGIIIQRALGEAGNPVPVDGIVGSGTREAMSNVDPEALREAINTEREDFIYKIVRNNPSQGKFLEGWLNRINKFKGDDNA